MVIKTQNKFKLFTIFTLVLIITLACISGVFGVLGSESERYIVRKAKSSYKIVVAAEADANEKSASRELQSFFKEATGVELPVITDEDVTKGGKYYSVGKTKIVDSDIESSLQSVKSQGYVIKTSGDTIYLLGPSSLGTLNAVYAYLHRVFNYEYYFTDVYSLNRGASDVEFEDHDIQVSPDIDGMSTPSVGYIMYNSTNRQRFGSMSNQEWTIPANGSVYVHNLFRIMDPDVYCYTDEDEDEEESSEEKEADPNYHPKWFTDNKATGCFTAHGDEAEYAAMQELFLSVVIKGLKESDAEVFLVAQPDNCGFCSCKSCGDLAAQYGGNSAVLIKFCNELSRKVLAWFETEEGAEYKRDFKLLFLAYQACASAPTNTDIKCDDNVGVYIAFDSYRSSYGLHEDQHNENLYNIVQEWKNYTHNFVFWIYDVNFDNYFYPYDTTAYKQDFYRVMKEVGTLVVNDQSQTQNSMNATAWNNVKSYISTKLRWDVEANVSELTVNFFKNCYKDAWEIMYEVYNEYKAHWANLKYKASQDSTFDTDNDLRSIFGHLNNTNYWSRKMLEDWISKFKQALEKIAPLAETDKATYDKAYMMICGEMISPMYMLLALYKSDYSESELAVMKKEFKKYGTDSKVTFFADGTSCPITVLYERLGID